MTEDKPAEDKPESAGQEQSNNLIIPNDPQSESFIRGLIERGEATRSDASGELPKGATHEIVGETSDGKPILRRRRFSIFGR
jgi:hypothetical protein